MSTRFEKFMPLILEHEGGFVNNQLDPGGATKYGVSLRFLKAIGDFNKDGQLDGDLDHDGDVDINDIRLLTTETVKPFYKQHFYDRMHIEDFKDESLAVQVFDFGINAGTMQAIKVLQRLCGLLDDGIIGPRTLEHIKSTQPCMMPAMYMQARISFYEKLTQKNPKLLAFLKGWKRRAQHCTF